MEQVLELATDGQEKAPEAPRRVIFMMKTALILAALLTRHVPPERVVIVLLGHALNVPLAHVVARLVQQRRLFIITATITEQITFSHLTSLEIYI